MTFNLLGVNSPSINLASNFVRKKQKYSQRGMQYLHQIKLAYVMLKVNYCYIKSQLDYCNAIFFISSKIMSAELPFTSILVWMYPHYWNSCIGYLWRRGLSTNEQLGHIILTAAFLLTFLSLTGCDSSRKEVNMGKAFRWFFLYLSNL